MAVGSLWNPKIFALAFGHFGVDMYPNVLPILYPLLMSSFSLSYAGVGILQMAYTTTLSLMQPLFGYLADRYGARYFAVGGVITISTFMGLLGFAWDFPSALVILAIAGTGSAAFHPQGAMNIAAVTTPERRATAMSMFMASGNIGFAVGPLVGAIILTLPWGLHSTALLPIPGLLVALWLTRLMVKVDAAKMSAMAQIAPAATKASRGAVIALVMVVLITMLRYWAFGGVNNFLPMWYLQSGQSLAQAGALLSAMLLAVACGGLIGGYLADRFGRQRVVVASMLVTSPLIGLLLRVSEPWVFPVGVTLGITFGFSTAVTLVMAQEFLPRQMGMASGLILGVAFVTAGIGMTVTGWLADIIGLGSALDSLMLLPLIGGAVGCFLPRIGRESAPLPASMESQPGAR